MACSRCIALLLRARPALYLLIMLALKNLRYVSARRWGRFPAFSRAVQPRAMASWTITRVPRGGGSDFRPFISRGGEQDRRSLATTTSKPLHSNTNLQVSVCAVQGFRSYMEDEYLVAQDFAAVFDGHGGKAVSRYLRQNLFAHLQAALPSVLYHKQQQDDNDSSGSSDSSSSSTEPTVEEYCLALGMALDQVDREVQRISHWSYQGSTAVAAWLHHNTTTSTTTTTEDSSTTTTLIVANVGDSRAVYGCNGTALPLTRDHKPDDPLETKRIQQAGGSVVWCGPYGKDGQPVLDKGIYRVNGNLALSRAIGDRSERPAVTAKPDITYCQVLKKKSANDNNNNKPRPKEYVVLATDGLWDVFTNQEVVTLVDLLLEKTKGALRHQRSKISDVLVREALRRGSFDNVTVIIIWLHTGDDDEEEEGTIEKEE